MIKIGSAKYNVTNLDQVGRKVAKALTKDVVNEHYLITKDKDSNLNYLWWMYKDGNKKDQFNPFIFNFELNLLEALDIINKDQSDHISQMLNSEDLDNTYIAVCSISYLRKERIEKHGEYGKSDNVSDEFKEVIDRYPSIVVKSYLSFGK